MVIDEAAVADHFRREDARSTPDPRVSAEFQTLHPNDAYSSEEERERRRSSASGGDVYDSSRSQSYAQRDLNARIGRQVNDPDGIYSPKGMGSKPQPWAQNAYSDAGLHDGFDQASSVSSELEELQPPCEQLVNDYERARSPARLRPAQRALLAASATAAAEKRRDRQQALLTAGMGKAPNALKAAKMPRLPGGFSAINEAANWVVGERGGKCNCFQVLCIQKICASCCWCPCHWSLGLFGCIPAYFMLY